MALNVSLLRAVVFAVVLCGGTVWAQRVQFPSMIDEAPLATSPTLPPGPQPGFSPPSTFGAPSTTAPAFDPYASPLTQPPGGFTPFSSPAPYTAPSPYSPYAPSPYAPPPTQPLYPDGLSMPQVFPDQSYFQQTLRLLNEIRLRWTWMPSNGAQPLGINDVETSATFTVPLFNLNTPFLITPGFAIHFFDGPPSVGPVPADLPPRTYDAYLDTGWHPQITPWLGANLGVRVGVYTDFDTFTTESIRVMGRGLGIVTLTPTVQLAAGVVYIDRVRIKLLPAGGIIYTPSPDKRFDILFPNPKLAGRWTTLGTTDVWVYLSGEYGGGSWTADRDPPVGSDQFDYNDIRVNLGIESFGARGVHMLFEVGYVFERELFFRSAQPQTYELTDTVMLRAGISY